VYDHIPRRKAWCNTVVVIIIITVLNMFCFSTLLYLKFLVLWALVLFADFILEFRFEFLWPFWLLLRSVYDSFKYQGLVSILYLYYAL
jgi:Transmembrane protein.